MDIGFLKSYRGWTVLPFKSISKDVKTPLTIPLLSYAELNFLSSKILLTDQIPRCTAFHLQYTWHESEENKRLFMSTVNANITQNFSLLLQRYLELIDLAIQNHQSHYTFLCLIL